MSQWRHAHSSDCVGIGQTYLHHALQTESEAVAHCTLFETSYRRVRCETLSCGSLKWFLPFAMQLKLDSARSQILRRQAHILGASFSHLRKTAGPSLNPRDMALCTPERETWQRPFGRAESACPSRRWAGQSWDWDSLSICSMPHIGLWRLRLANIDTSLPSHSGQHSLCEGWS